MYQHWKHLETLKDITSKTPRILENPPFQIVTHHRNMFFVLLSMSETAWILQLMHAWDGWIEINDFYMISINALSVYHRLSSSILCYSQISSEISSSHPGGTSDKEKTSRLQRSESIIQKNRKHHSSNQKTPTAIFSLCCLNKLVKKTEDKLGHPSPLIFNISTTWL